MTPDRSTLAIAALAWATVYAFWLATTRAFHPSWAIAACATGLLVGSYATAVTLNLGPLARLRSRRGPRAYLLALLGVEVVLTMMVVPAIQGVYAVLWHPDPRRFGFWTNAIADFAGMNLHVLGAWLAARAYRRIQQGPDRPGAVA